MFCTKCGNKTVTGDVFCKYCGNKLRTDEPGSDVRSTMGVTPVRTAPVAPVAYGASYKKPVAAAKLAREAKRSRDEYRELTHETIREQGRSAVFLFVAIFYTLAILGQLFDSNTGMGMWVSMLEELDVSSEMRREIRELNNGDAWWILLLTMTPQFLTMLSYWLIYGGSYSRYGHGCSGAGLMILKVLQVIRVVVLSLLMFLLFLLMMSSCSAVSEYANDEAMALIFFTFSALIGVVVMALIVSAKAIATCDNIRRSMEIGSPDSDVSGFLAVMIMLSGTLNVILVAFDAEWYTLLLGIAQVMLGLKIFFYKGAMKELENVSDLYDSGYSSLRKTPGAMPTWKRMEIENGFGPGDLY